MSSSPESDVDVRTMSDEALVAALVAADGDLDVVDRAAGELHARLARVELDDPDARLVGALAAAQGEFPKIERKNTATVTPSSGKPGYSYTYADLGDVLAAVRPVLAKHGLAITQPTIRDGGNVILRTELRHVGGAILESEVDLGQKSSNPQQFGGALTYLRRYELTTLLGIAAEEDRDAQDVEPERRREAAPELPGWARPATKARKAELVAALEPLLGRERATAIGVGIANSLGHVPDVVVGAGKLFAAEVLDELGAAGLGELLAVRTAEREREAAAAAQDAAAEAPDAPAPEELAGDEEPYGPPADAGLSEEEAKRLEPEEPPAGEPSDPDAPPPGTVDAPNGVHFDGLVPVTLGDEEVLERLRAAGCVCANPEKSGDAGSFDDACPIKGHGIPF